MQDSVEVPELLMLIVGDRQRLHVTDADGATVRDSDRGWVEETVAEVKSEGDCEGGVSVSV